MSRRIARCHGRSRVVAIVFAAILALLLTSARMAWSAVATENAASQAAADAASAAGTAPAAHSTAASEAAGASVGVSGLLAPALGKLKSRPSAVLSVLAVAFSLVAMLLAVLGMKKQSELRRWVEEHTDSKINLVLAATKEYALDEIRIRQEKHESKLAARLAQMRAQIMNDVEQRLGPAPNLLLSKENAPASPVATHPSGSVLSPELPAKKALPAQPAPSASSEPSTRINPLVVQSILPGGVGDGHMSEMIHLEYDFVDQRKPPQAPPRSESREVIGAPPTPPPPVPVPPRPVPPLPMAAPSPQTPSARSVAPPAEPMQSGPESRRTRSANASDTELPGVIMALRAIQDVADGVLADATARDPQALTEAIRKRGNEVVNLFLQGGYSICAHNFSAGLCADFDSPDFLSASRSDGGGWLFPNPRAGYAQPYRSYFDGDRSLWPRFSRPARCSVDRSNQARVLEVGKL